MNAIAPVFRVEQIGDATLYLGDCRDVLPTLRNIDLVVTDPPYGINAADWDTEVPLWSLPKIRESLVEGGACYWFGTPPHIWTVGLSRVLDFQREIIWWHGTGYPGRNNFRLATETVLFMSKGDPCYFNTDAIREEYEPRPERPRGRPGRQNPMGKSPGNVMCAPRPAPRHDDETEHPHAKPVSLLSKFVLVSCPPDGVVMDPFMGSCSAGAAAIKLGRRFIGIEQDSSYFDVACKRMDEEQRQGVLL